MTNITFLLNFSMINILHGLVISFLLKRWNFSSIEFTNNSIRTENFAHTLGKVRLFNLYYSPLPLWGGYVHMVG